MEREKSRLREGMIKGDCVRERKRERAGERCSVSFR
jgi:hypothetical protein